MPPKGIKDSPSTGWSPAAERDLIMAALTSDVGNHPKINWPKVKETMDAMGYNFTRSAMDQRWSKKIMKEWRDRRSNIEAATPAASGESAASTPTNNKKRPRGLAVARARARAKQAAAEMAAAAEDGNVDDSEYDSEDKARAKKLAKATLLADKSTKKKTSIVAPKGRKKGKSAVKKEEDAADAHTAETTEEDNEVVYQRERSVTMMPKREEFIE